MKVNLGCGTNIVEGFVNIDNYSLHDNKDFVKGDAKDIPLESDSVDYLLCDQVLEHIPTNDIPVVLFNIRRVLKPGGKCVIVVPDFEGAVRQWLEGVSTKPFDPMTYKWFSDVIYGNQEHEGEFHKTAMTPGFLHYMLNMVGLTNHTITFHPAFGEVPSFEGMRPVAKDSVLRNAQLVAEVVK